MIKLYSVGGYCETGKNCTALEINDEAVILDMGLHLDNYIEFTKDEKEDVHYSSSFELMKVGAVPDISFIEKIKNKVKAIIPTHAHLDHVGAIPFLAKKFKAPIIGTPFTISVINSILRDEKIKLKNELKILNPNSSYKISDKITVEFVNMTHSTPQTVMVAVHTSEGVILYANDFKFDNTPLLGKKPNFKRLKELGEQGILALVVDSLYAGNARKTPSESVAKNLLKDVLLGTNSENQLIVVTTFSSHLARLKSIIEFGKKLNRNIVFLGRSLAKYVNAGEDVNIINFRKKAEIVKYGSKIGRKLEEINKRRSQYLLVVTGHQGEPRAVLSKIANKKFPFKLLPGDMVVFSSSVIPTPLNIKNRAVLEEVLKKQGVRIFRDIHASGHASREDLRDLITMIRPKHIIPAHGDKKMATALSDLAKELGYESKFIHILKDGQSLVLK